MNTTPDTAKSRDGWKLVALVILGLMLRAAAAFAVERYVESKGTLCVFPDTDIYWKLAGAIDSGKPYQVMQWDVPHRAIRTPGYPLFLAACRGAFGSKSLMPVRLVQAALGAFSVLLVYALVRKIRPHGRAALMAAGLAAVEPYTVAMSALVLSEALFVPMMLASLWGLASLWPHGGYSAPRRYRLASFLTGAASGAAILARPSWALAVPMLLACWVVGAGRGKRRKAIQGSILVAIGSACLMAPWWVRNERVFGRFVPTVLWVGASLYDGLSPSANGASEMKFLKAEDVRGLDEKAQDDELRARAIEFARDHPKRALELAAIKVGRFWSPWPNADTMRSPLISAASAAVTLPIFALMALGIARCRRDGRALALLLLPLLYFCALHAVFVSSIRYRIPAQVPALGLAAIGALAALRRDARRAAEPAVESPCPPPSPPSRLARVGKALAWGVILVFACLAGALACAYMYVTDGEMVARAVEQKAPKYLPGSRLSIVRAQLKPLLGEVTFNYLTLNQRVDGRMVESANIRWLRVSSDVGAALRGEFKVREIVVAQPVFRLRRRKDGTWNVQGLLASPWPGPSTTPPPVIRIKGGSIELVESNAPGASPSKVLRDVAATIESTPAGLFRFEGTAQGDAFERLAIEGEIDSNTGRLSLTKGDLTRLEVSPTLVRRLPPEARKPIEAAGVTAGEIDLSIRRLVRDPSAPAGSRWRYAAGVELRGGAIACPKMPFAFTDVEASATIREGRVEIEKSSARNGKTVVRLGGSLSTDDPTNGPLDLDVRVVSLELDERLKKWTPPKFAKLWAQYRPAGWVDLAAHVARDRAGESPRWDLRIDCLDVAMKYELFPYPLEHVRGTLTWPDPKTLFLDMVAVVGNKPLTAKGTILDPGERGVADLEFKVGSIPIDAALMDALPADARAVVTQFHPAGSARGTARLRRWPLPPGGDPKGKVALDVFVDLNEGCSMKWDGLPYPVSNVTGHLEIRPDLWTFTDMRGENGPARLRAKGMVIGLPGKKLDVVVQIDAEHMSFDPQLRSALPPAWQTTWSTLNPGGSSRVEAKIHVAPGVEDHWLKVVPDEGARVQLELTPAPGTPFAAPGAKLQLPPMEKVRGTFVFDNGKVSMSDVTCLFHGAPTQFREGKVRLFDGGRFNLKLTELEVADLRLDGDLRALMPPLMQQFARRLDDGRPFGARADLGIYWSGQSGQPAVCTWENAEVVFTGNTIQGGLPIGPIQGQVEGIKGWSDGRTLIVDGVLNIDSIDLLGQQVTALKTPIHVGEGWAKLKGINADLLGGKVGGDLGISLDATPEYRALVTLQGADLARYTQTLPGRQHLRGLVSGRAEFNGRGNDLHTLQGRGSARVEKGDIGTLPFGVPMLKLLSWTPPTRTAFDSASVAFVTQDGLTTLRPVSLSGDVFSLTGEGEIDAEGNINLPLSIVFGRDDGFRLSGLKDKFSSSVGGKVLKVRVHGSIASPQFDAAPLPGPAGVAGNLLQRLGERRGSSADRR